MANLNLESEVYQHLKIRTALPEVLMEEAARWTISQTVMESKIWGIFSNTVWGQKTILI